MQSKHTPGPWFLIEDDGVDFTAIATAPEIEGRFDPEREVLGSSEWLRVTREDLLLMAAAPELLEALRELRSERTDRTERMADAAIAKACEHDAARPSHLHP